MYKDCPSIKENTYLKSQLKLIIWNKFLTEIYYNRYEVKKSSKRCKNKTKTKLHLAYF